MGSQVSPNGSPLHGIIQAKSSKYHHSPPRLWLRYVDDTFIIQKEEQKQQFLKHINSVDLAIRFTVEDKENSAIPFLDALHHSV